LGEVRQALGGIIKDGHRACEIIDRIRALAKKAPPWNDQLDNPESFNHLFDAFYTTKPGALEFPGRFLSSKLVRAAGPGRLYSDASEIPGPEISP
jgi:hypothetical protein